MSDEAREFLRIAKENYGWAGFALALVGVLWKIGAASWRTVWLFVNLAFTGPFRLAAMEQKQMQREQKLDRIETAVGAVEKTQEEMRASLERACAIQDAQINYLTDGFWLSDFAGRCTMASLGLCHITGRTLNELLAEGWRSSIHPDDIDRVERAWTRSVAMSLEFRLQYRYVRPDGTVTAANVNAKRIPQGWAGFVSIIRSEP